MTEPKPKKKGCRQERTKKGLTIYVSTTCPAGKALVNTVARKVKKQLGL